MLNRQTAAVIRKYPQEMNHTAARLIRWTGQHKPDNITEAAFRAGVAAFANRQEEKVRHTLPCADHGLANAATRIRGSRQQKSSAILPCAPVEIIHD